MSARAGVEPRHCTHAGPTCVHALQALPARAAAAAEAHIASCAPCRQELDSLRALVGRFAAWPTDVLRPGASLQQRLAQRIAEGIAAVPVPPRQWSEPPWENVAPGIECKLLATDAQRHRISMLVRLAPDTQCPAHRCARIEELHLLDGELRIDGRKLEAGDCSHGARDSEDADIWSETGCTCVLVASGSGLLDGLLP